MINSVEMSVTNELSKRCNMHFETPFNGHLKLHEEHRIE